ncbi:MAG: helix-turn-helix domain-containing protein [Sedimentisphaeraceae bacterium JB056]
MSEDRFEGLIKIGLRIRENRKLRGLSLEELSQRAGVTKSLMSKFENFRAIPSLPVLSKIASAMQIDMAELVKNLGEETAKPYTVIKAQNRGLVERDDAIGFLHEAVTSKDLGEYIFESIVLTLEPGSSRKTVTTEGYQFIYILEGKLDFVIGPDLISMEKDDAMFFDGRIPHVPENKHQDVARLLAIYLIENKLK